MSSSPTGRAAALDQQCIDAVKVLSMDAVQAANSGHPGTPMAMAPVAYSIWQRMLRFDPQDPLWPNRDRFVLSMGHASMLQYSMRSDPLREYVAWLGEVVPEMGRPYSLRYSGALVADLHRCLLEGGLYLYPADHTHPEGKLRRVYECAPLAFVMEQAGGCAVDWNGGALESLHQRSPLILGGESDVRVCEAFLRGDPTPLRALER